MLLKGKSVLITGCSQGIGQGIAQAIAFEGARVIITDKSESKLQATLALLKQMKAEVLPLEMDVTQVEQISSGIEKAVSQFGKLDGLVNNAGVFIPEDSMHVTKWNFEVQLDVNVVGLFNCCQAAARVMKEQTDGGRIVNISSNGGKIPFPGFVPYSATKAAVINMTQALAKEWSSYKINVNAVCPGGVDTPMLASVAEHIAQKTGQNEKEILNTLVPPQLGRHVRPIEVGRVVAFLLSDNAEIIRGQSISIDGGETPY